MVGEEQGNSVSNWSDLKENFNIHKKIPAYSHKLVYFAAPELSFNKGPGFGYTGPVNPRGSICEFVRQL